MTIQYLEADKEYITNRIESSKFYNIDSELLKSMPLLEKKRRIYINKITDIIFILHSILFLFRIIAVR